VTVYGTRCSRYAPAIYGGLAQPVAPDDLAGSYANRPREPSRGATDRIVVVPAGLTQPSTEDSDLGVDTQQSTTRISRPCGDCPWREE
jgi:hypothetical protein